MEQETMKDIFDRTMANCRFYEKQDDELKLLNEIGVLRGVAYCLQLAGICPHSEEFAHFIGVQQTLIKQNEDELFEGGIE